MAVKKNNERVVVDPEIMAGKPVIQGTRIPVYIILELLSAGQTIKEVLKTYPDLEKEDVLAAITYANGLLKDAEVVEKKLVA